MNSNQRPKMKWGHKVTKKHKFVRMNGNKFRSQDGETENWEEEIEECACSKEDKDQPPYDSGDDMNTAEMTPCAVQNSKGLNQDRYSPAVHHTLPVKWVRCIYTVVADQFADAED